MCTRQTLVRDNERMAYPVRHACDRTDRCGSRSVIDQQKMSTVNIDLFSGLEIRMADSTYLMHGRTRVQRNEGVEIVVSVKNERNLASLTVYGDIEGQEQNVNSSSNELYITAGVVSWSSVCSLLIESMRSLRWISRGKAKEQKRFSFVPITVEWWTMKWLNIVLSTSMSSMWKQIYRWNSFISRQTIVMAITIRTSLFKRSVNRPSCPIAHLSVRMPFR